MYGFAQISVWRFCFAQSRESGRWTGDLVGNM